MQTRRARLTGPAAWLGPVVMAPALVGLAILVAWSSTVWAAGPATPTPSTTSLSIAGTRAFDMARRADDGAAVALEEGETALAEVKKLAPADRIPETLKPLLAEADEARQALVAYRRQAQDSAGETLKILVEVSRVTVQATPDPIRRETLEQRALLAAHEAAVMSARARAEAERLRAVLAEARALGVAGSPGGKAPPRGAGAKAPDGATPSEAAVSAGPKDGTVAVPNLIGSRLEAATRDLTTVGLRVGGVSGPRGGFVVKQIPEPGARLPSRASVSLTLSETAATTTVVTPQ